MLNNNDAVELKLRESLDYIKSNNNLIEQTDKYVWGKDIRLPDGTSYELDTWSISLPYTDNKTDINTLIDNFKYLVWQKDNSLHIIDSCDDYSNYLCHQLCDWLWLSDDKNRIVINGIVTIVKYAKILKKTKEVVEE